METPGQGARGGAAVTTKVIQRAVADAPGEASEQTPSAPVDNLKHVYSGITLTRDHLATVLGCLRDCCRKVDIHANTFQLTDLDQLEAVFSEDKIIENLRISATDPHDGEMSLIVELGYVEIEASNASWAPAFRMIVRLLDAIPKNGTQMCGITMRRPKIGDAAVASRPSGTTTAPSLASAPPAAPLPMPTPSPTALARAAMAAAAAPAQAERARTQAGDRQRTVGSGTARVERPRETATVSAQRHPAPSASALTPPASAPTQGAPAATSSEHAASTRPAPLLLHLVGDLALMACIVLNWRSIADGLATAVLIALAIVCIGGAVLWTFAARRAQRRD